MPRSPAAVHQSSQAPPAYRPGKKVEPERMGWKTFVAAAVAVLIALILWKDRTMKDNYVFSPQTLNEIANRALMRTLPLSSDPSDLATIEPYPSPHSIQAPASYVRRTSANQTRAVFDAVVEEMEKVYGGKVRLNTREEWAFNNAGGAMGAMWVLHASLTEYVMIFGTPLGTEGHSGRYPLVDDYFTILVGEEWAYLPGNGAEGVRKLVYPPGSTNHLPRSVVFQYKMHEGCFALELAQGWIPSMLFFGFADFFTSTLDFPSLAHNVWITIREMGGNALRGKF
ncbi:ERG2 and sigma1 receptor-like protein [Atractiella rhizophila]|nr:ERG2 and sigma1 receptor-like protein [Atractiella rhizophila]